MSQYKGKYLYEFKINTGFAGGTHEDEYNVLDDFTKEEWDDMTEEEQEEELSDFGNAMLQTHIELFWKPIEG